MQDGTGATFSWRQLEGRWSLVYFGYRGCPSACPTGLAALAREVRALGLRGKDLQVVMVTVDPDQDTPKLIGDYVRYFHPDFRAVRIGDARELDLVCRAFGATWAKPATLGGEIEHSLDVHLVDPRGRIRGRLSPPFVPGELRQALHW